MAVRGKRLRIALTLSIRSFSIWLEGPLHRARRILASEPSSRIGIDDAGALTGISRRRVGQNRCRLDFTPPENHRSCQDAQRRQRK